MKTILSLCLAFILALIVVGGTLGVAADRQAAPIGDPAWTDTLEPGVSGLETPRQAAAPITQRPTVLPDGTVVAQYCCRHCSSGKPCGDSCIARNKSCNKGRGCACAGPDIF